MDDKRDYLGSIIKYDILGCGAYSTVYDCEYLETPFAYKEFIRDNVALFFKDKLERVTDYSSKDCVVPFKFIYKLPTDEVFQGYVMEPLYQYEGLDKLFALSNEDKLDILKKSRIILENFHKHNCVHADVCPWNFQYNDRKKGIKLIDFDNNIDLSKKDVGDLRYYNDITQEYIKNVGVDKNLDIFLYNISAFAFLNNVDYFKVLKCINDGYYGYFNDNSKIKAILDSYKNLECEKTLKKEYVIDYI